MAKRAPNLEQVVAAAARPRAATSGRTGTVAITIHVDPGDPDAVEDAGRRAGNVGAQPGVRRPQCGLRAAP